MKSACSVSAYEELDATGPEAATPRYRLSRAIGLAGFSGAVGLAMLAAVGPVARWSGVSPTVLEMCVLPFLLNAVNIAVIAWALRHYEGRRLTAAAVGLWPIRWETRYSAFSVNWKAWLAFPVLLVVALGPLHRWSVDAVWHVLPGPGWSADSTPAILRGALPIHMTVGLLAFELLIRLPFSVLVEEAFMSGFLYPRLGPWAFVNVGLVGCAYHLFQWWTIPYLLPYGIAMGLLRRRFGNPWPNIGWHYATNAIYFCTLVK